MTIKDFRRMEDNHLYGLEEMGFMPIDDINSRKYHIKSKKVQKYVKAINGILSGKDVYFMDGNYKIYNMNLTKLFDLLDIRYLLDTNLVNTIVKSIREIGFIAVLSDNHECIIWEGDVVEFERWTADMEYNEYNIVLHNARRGLTLEVAHNKAMVVIKEADWHREGNYGDI